MENDPIIVEKILGAPVDEVWKAISDRDEMQKWYFDIAAFKAEPGFRFQFEGGSETKKYLHLCEVTEAVPEKKLGYSWRYDGMPGSSMVTFELSELKDKTKLKLTHRGVESFSATDNPDFQKKSFVEGWNHIIGKLLPEYLEKS